MFGYTIEVITLAASNSLFVFGFCNLIIVILLVGGSRTSSEFDQGTPILRPSIIADINTNDIEEANDNKNETFIGVREDTSEDEAEDEDEDEDEASCEEEEEDDELRRRVEEFIEKNNRSWRAEKLRTSQLV